MLRDDVRLRMAREFSPKEIARMTGLSLRQVYRIEGDRWQSVTVGTVRKLMAALDVALDDLVDWERMRDKWN